MELAQNMNKLLGKGVADQKGVVKVEAEDEVVIQASRPTPCLDGVLVYFSSCLLTSWLRLCNL